MGPGCFEPLFDEFSRGKLQYMVIFFFSFHLISLWFQSSEVFACQQYSGVAADLFALGVSASLSLWLPAYLGLYLYNVHRFASMADTKSKYICSELSFFPTEIKWLLFEKTFEFEK